MWLEFSFLTQLILCVPLSKLSLSLSVANPRRVQQRHPPNECKPSALSASLNITMHRSSCSEVKIMPNSLRSRDWARVANGLALVPVHARLLTACSSLTLLHRFSSTLNPPKAAANCPLMHLPMRSIQES